MSTCNCLRLLKKYIDTRPYLSVLQQTDHVEFKDLTFEFCSFNIGLIIASECNDCGNIV